MVKNLPDNAGDSGSIPGWERRPGEGNGHPLQYSSLENPVDGGAWWATAHGDAKQLDMRSLAGYSPWGHTKSDTTARLHFTSD